MNVCKIDINDSYRTNILSLVEVFFLDLCSEQIPAPTQDDHHGWMVV